MVQGNREMQDREFRKRLGGFTFLGLDDGCLPFDEKLLARLAGEVVLSLKDKDIYKEIYECLRQKGKIPFQWTPQESKYLNNNSQDKWLDYIIYRYKFKIYPKRKIIAQFPVYLLIELTSMCNLRCKMCYQGDQTFMTKKYMGSMDYGLFCDIVDQAEEGGTKAITLGSRGEPFLYKNISKSLHYLSNKFIEIKLLTNATKLTEKDCHDILSSNVNLLIFSVDAHTKKMYEEIRVRGNFDDVYRNIIRFEEIRAKEYPGSKIITRVSGVKVTAEQDEAAFYKFWSKICDEVGMKKAAERWSTYENTPRANSTSPCSVLWERMYVFFDGSVNPCDLDYKGKLEVGNFREKTISEIWNGDKYNNLRKLHLDGSRHRLFPCDRCGF